MQHNNQTPFISQGNDPLFGVTHDRVRHKMQSYASYHFTQSQLSAINSFFDLAQEFTDINQLYTLPVIILRVFFDLAAELYIKSPDGVLRRVTPEICASPLPEQLCGPNAVLEETLRDSTRWFFPVRGKRDVFLPNEQRVLADDALLGLLLVAPVQELSPHEQLFLEKFVNRVGFCLHNRLLADTHARHILFVRKLAHDIGHNVITPNIQLKLMLKQQDSLLSELEQMLLSETNPVYDKLKELHTRMNKRAAAIGQHFKYASMFLESLLRQSHFDEGHYVLRLSRLDLCALVVVPLFERFRPQLQEKGINIDPEQPVIANKVCLVHADMGLISQVLANLLANAVKYTTPVNDTPAVVRCAVTHEPGYFSCADGVQVSVFSSGQPIDADESVLLFQDSYRGANAITQQGTGHGLFFVSEIIAEHGGHVGHRPEPNGNTFYFVLPLAE